ncbi:MAG: hypothetical protein COA79_12070 [Planctomycetota bacterium]|nr:MAG: hypothetical protein COA79_12070 [Planctomycetota bacterium]
MKQIQLTNKKTFQLAEVKNPELINTNDVLVKMKSIGVCGSDIHYFEDGQIGDQKIIFPFTIGHEGSGIIEEIGSNVNDLKVGDRVAIEPAISCGECDQCLNQRPHTCLNLSFIGCPGQRSGCLSEFLPVPSKNCIKIPDDMTYQEATFAEPLSIGIYAVEQSKAMNHSNPTMGILGSGPIGLSVLSYLNTLNLNDVLISDPLQDRLHIAKSIGCNKTITPDLIDNEQDKFLNSFDIIYECCGQEDSFQQAFQLLKPGGELVIVGIPPTLDHWQLPVGLSRRKEITIKNIRRQNNCMEKALELIGLKKIQTDKLITHNFNLEQTQEAFDLVSGYQDGILKAMINIS